MNPEQQMVLPYKHPSNTLTTIPRAIRRLTRSGRRTVEQVEAELIRLGVKGYKTMPDGSCRANSCVLANYFAVHGLRTWVRSDKVSEAGTNSRSTPLPPVLREVVKRFDDGASPAALYMETP